MKEYALSKPNAVITNAKTYINIKTGKKSILKLRVKRNALTALFALENDMLKAYRKENDGSVIRVKPTEITLSDKAALKTAMDMVDLTIEQIEKDKAELLERRRQKRRQQK